MSAAMKDGTDDDAASRLAQRAEELVIGRRWREASEVVRAGEAVAKDRPHRSRALFGALGDAAAIGAAAEAARTSLDLTTFPGFEHGRVLVVEPTGDDALFMPQEGRQWRPRVAGASSAASGGGGSYATLSAALDAAADGDVVLLRPGTHRVTCPRDGEGLAIDKRVMITGSAGPAGLLGPGSAVARAKIYHCGNAPALRLRRPCVLRSLAVETDGFREAVLLEAGGGEGVLGKERLRQHARLGVPLALLWGCSVRSAGDDAVHVAGSGNGSSGDNDGVEHCSSHCDDALLVGCELSAPSEGKSALVVAQGARVRAARGCALGPCGGSGALVLGPRSALALEGPGTAVDGCARDGVAVADGGALSIIGGAAVRHCRGAAVDASGSTVSVGGGGGVRLGEGCRGGALMLWDGATAEVSTSSGEELGASELIGGEGGSGAFAVVVGPPSGGGVKGGCAVAVAPSGGGDSKRGATIDSFIRGDAFVAAGASSEHTVRALLRLGATKVVVSDAASAGDRARLPEPAGAFSPPLVKARFTPRSFA